MSNELANRLAALSTGEGGVEELQDMPAVVTRRVIGLKKLQERAEALDEEYKKERLQLEVKFSALRQPLHEQRQRIVAGEVEPELTAEEMAQVEDVEATPEGQDEIKGIPGFWVQCLTNSMVIGDISTDEDVAALNYLTDIQCSYNEDMTSFTLKFLFRENPFFTDSVSLMPITPFDLTWLRCADSEQNIQCQS